MSAPFTDSQGTTFTFDNVTYYATNIQESTSGGTDPNEQRIDVSTLDLASGSDRVYQDPPLIDRGPSGANGTITISLDYNGNTKPTMGSEAPLVCSTLGINGNATCTSVTRTLAVGEIVTGSAEFTLSATP
jgi:hypothetical protein